jgi:transposase
LLLENVANETAFFGHTPLTRQNRTNTCANLLKIETALWHFLSNLAVAPTNNAAERALRGSVIKCKLSFFTRLGRGLRFLERIFSTAQTCALQG